jgi:hypothetical protein
MSNEQPTHKAPNPLSPVLQELEDRADETASRKARAYPSVINALKFDKDRACAMRLRNAMSDLSEDCWAAEWLFGSEYMLWHFLRTGPGDWGMWHVSKEDIAHLRELSEQCGGWWMWEEEKGEVFVPMERWLEVVREHDARQSSGGRGFHDNA